MIRNSRKYRRLKAIKNARKATNKSIKARVIITDDEKDLELKENEVEREGVAYEIPQHPTEEVTVRMYPENVSDEEFLQYIESIVDKERHIQEEDPSDQYLLELYDKEKQVFRKDQFPDGWRNPIYPAGKKSPTDQTQGEKPNIDGIKFWVENVKLAGKSQRELEQEYNIINRQDSMETWTDGKMERMIDQIAFMVARKIWYVGRKPSDMSDEEWENETKHMRPNPETYQKTSVGGYGVGAYIAGNEGVNGLKYHDEEYTYSSGDPDYVGKK